MDEIKACDFPSIPLRGVFFWGVCGFAVSDASAKERVARCRSVSTWWHCHCLDVPAPLSNAAILSCANVDRSNAIMRPCSAVSGRGIFMLWRSSCVAFRECRHFAAVATFERGNISKSRNIC